MSLIVNMRRNEAELARILDYNGGLLMLDGVEGDDEAILNLLQIVLKDHEREGWFDAQSRIFLGIENDLQNIFQQFLFIIRGRSDDLYKLSIRLSCTSNDLPDSYTVSFYLSRRIFEENGRRVVYQITYYCPKNIGLFELESLIRRSNILGIPTNYKIHEAF